MKRPKILLLTSSLLVDRVFIYTNLVNSLNEYADTFIWAVSKGDENNSGVWDDVKARVEVFPQVKPFKEFPHNYLRRLNELAWDFRHRIPSRMTMMNRQYGDNRRRTIRALKFPAKIMAACRAEEWFENKLEKMMLEYPRSTEAEKRLREMQPSVIVVTGAFQYEQPAVFAAAKKIGIPVLAYIPSWDNVTTKSRFVFKYDGYLVWSKQTEKELRKFYPAAESLPVYAVGAPQFDIFRQKRFYVSREEFCRENDLLPELPVILYAVGSPNFLQEHHGAVNLAERISRGELGKVQMLVRPHPIHDNSALQNIFNRFAPQVRLQKTHNAGKNTAERSQDENQIREWINTFRHADVVVNLSSTVTIDGAIFDKPVVNLDFDPQPGQADEKLIKDINHRWNHFKPVAESGGVWLVKNFDELAHAVKTYLRNPALHHAARKKIVEYVCEHTDGKCGERMASAVCDFVETSVLKHSWKLTCKQSPQVYSQIV